MSEMSDFTEDELVKHFFRTGSAAAASVMAVALLTLAASDADDGTFADTGTEVTNAGGYERANNANTGGGASNTTDPLDANWTATAGGDGQTDNASAITFGTATGNWGTVAAIALCNNATWGAGEVYFHTAVDTSKAVNTDDTAEFAIGALTITFA